MKNIFALSPKKTVNHIFIFTQLFGLHSVSTGCQCGYRSFTWNKTIDVYSIFDSDQRSLIYVTTYLKDEGQLRKPSRPHHADYLVTSSSKSFRPRAERQWQQIDRAYLTKVSEEPIFLYILKNVRICHLSEGRLLKYLILFTGNLHQMNANLFYFSEDEYSIRTIFYWLYYGFRGVKRFILICGT